MVIQPVNWSQSSLEKREEYFARFAIEDEVGDESGLEAKLMVECGE